MHEFDKIFLGWKAGQGSRRYIVGELSRSEGALDKFEFKYFRDEVEEALKVGFSPYTEFPDYQMVYKGNVLEVFSQRLTKAERPDIQKFYDFWEINPIYISDKFYLLGHTQGLSPGDNFEFLADYKPTDNLNFITELASLSKQNLPSDTLSIGDILRFEFEKDNDFDKEAVMVFKGDRFIGYIKQIHCRLFHKVKADRIRLVVKALEKNGIIKRAFIKVSVLP